MDTILVTPGALLGRNMHLNLLYNLLRDNGYSVYPFTIANVFKYRKRAIWHIHWIDGFFRGTLLRFGLEKDYFFISLARFSIFLLLLPWVKLFKLKIVWSVHNVCSHEHGGSFVEKWVTKLLLIFSDRVTGFNEYICKLLAEKYGFHRTILMRQGLYEDCYPDNVSRSDARKKLSIPENNFVLLMFGALQEYKGVDLLIKAFAAYESEHITLIIAGSSKNCPEYGKFLGELARHDERITLYDRYVLDDEVQYFFRAADYTIYPYRQISNSGTIFLSLTFGIPIIVSDKGGVREVTDIEPETRILIEELTEENILNAIRQSRKNGCDRAKMEKVQDELRWRNLKAEIMEVFDFSLPKSNANICH